MSLSSGDFVELRGRPWLVEASPQADPLSTIKLSCIVDDAQGEPLEVLWHAEIGASLGPRLLGGVPVERPAPKCGDAQRDRQFVLADLQLGVVDPPDTARRPRWGPHRNTFTRSSISSESRETWLFDTPEPPIGLTRSSTARVEIPCT